MRRGNAFSWSHSWTKANFVLFEPRNLEIVQCESGLNGVDLLGPPRVLWPLAQADPRTPLCRSALQFQHSVGWDARDLTNGNSRQPAAGGFVSNAQL